MSKYYQVALKDVVVVDNAFSFNVTIQGIQFQVTGSWDTVLQYQYNIIKNRLIDMSKSQPLYKDKTYNRIYDYIDYYTSLDPYGLNEWLDTSPALPLDIINLPRATQISVLQDRISFSNDLKPILVKYEEGLRWNVIVKDSNNIKTSAVIQPGGWFRNQADDYSFAFLSTKEYVGIDDLPYTVFIVEMKNG